MNDNFCIRRWDILEEEEEKKNKIKTERFIKDKYFDILKVEGGKT